VISTLFGKSPKCSTDKATILSASLPSPMSSMVFLSDSGFVNLKDTRKVDVL